MKLWMIAYVALTLFDVVVTYIFISGGTFDIADEGNAMIRTLMEKYGVWQGLSIYVVQEFAVFFLLWGVLYLTIMRLVKDRSQEIHNKVDIIVFNIGAPFFIMASALLHLFAGIFWLVIGFAGAPDRWVPTQFIVYVTVICGLLQAYHVFKLTTNLTTPSEQSLVSE